ncbi:hypothetical protein [Oceanobacillus salinisoli]|uniref:hypothetical protein n=1 Tax=Oceanobacillus salinisoli TaxID=2678611 RepID=UPI0012E314BA|nr:hypothetical protein [Oceanobacillus salinisoli]
MLQKLTSGNHAQPFRGPISITRVRPSDIYREEIADSAIWAVKLYRPCCIEKRLND